MHKCSQCGTEFEGKFCPECGTMRQEENCPNCGALCNNGAKFCTECGYSFITEPADNVRFRKPPKLVAESVLRYAPAALFALFSILLFAFFAAPLITAELFGYRETQSFYETFSSSDYNFFKPYLITLLVFAGACVFSAAVWILSIAFPNVSVKATKFFLSDPRLPKWQKKIDEMKEFSEKTKTVFAMIPAILQLGILIVSCIMTAKINERYGELGIFSVGACPVLLILFSILCALLQTGGIFGRKLLLKRNPEILEEKLGYTKEKEQKQQAWLEKRQRTLGEPIRPDIVKPKKPNLPPEIESVQKAMRYRRVHLSVIGATVLFLCWQVCTNCIKINTYSTVLILVLLGIFLYLALIAVCFLLQRNYYVSEFPEAKLSKIKKHYGGLNFMSLFETALFLAVFEFSMSKNINPKSIWISALPMFVCTAMEIFMIFYGVAGYKGISAFYGKKAYMGKTEFDELNADTLRYFREREAYKADRKNRLQAEIYDWQISRYKRGLPYDRRPSNAVLNLRTNRFIVSVVAAFAVITAVFWGIAGTECTNIFSVSRLENVRSHYKIEYFLGKPDATENDGCEYYYFSDNYLSIAKQIEKNTEKMLTATDERELQALIEKDIALNKKLNSITFRYIQISFSKTENGTSISSIVYDAKCCNDSAQITSKKWDTGYEGKIKLSYRHVMPANTLENITAEIYYRDGSYRYTSLSDGVAYLADPQTNEFRFEWSDRWGNYSVTEKVN